MKKDKCPDEFYNNCLNALKKCRICIASTGSGKLYYEPVEDIGEHPYHKDSDKQRVLRKAKETEKRVEKEIARGTLRSGATLGDGDLKILDSLRVEVKDRGSRSTWNLTWTEYIKGRKQSIDVFAINVECPDKQRRTIYMIEESLFSELIAHLKEKKNE